VSANVVGKVGVEPLLDGTSRDRQSSSSCGSFDGLEIQTVGCARRDQGLDFLDDLGVERLFEPPFLAASVLEVAWGAASWASAQCSQAPQ